MIHSQQPFCPQVLLYHVVSRVISSDMADNDIKLDSVQGSPLLVNLYLKSKFYDVRTEYSQRLLIAFIIMSSF